MQLGEAFHVQLIDEGLVPWGARRAVIPPGKGRIDDHRQGRIGGAVPLVEGQVRFRIAYTIAEELVGPPHIAADGLGIGIEQHLVGVKTVALLRLIGAMDAIAIELPR